MKHFLSTTALILTMAGTAHADGHATGFGMVEFEQGDFFASDLIGMRIYNAEGETETGSTIADGDDAEWNDVGEINDIIVGNDGEVRAVILGIGGFLGLGERDVSVSMDAIKIVQEEGENGDRFLVVNTSKEALENAPEFVREDEAMTAGTQNAEAAEEAEPAQNAETETAEANEVSSDAGETEMADNTAMSEDEDGEPGRANETSSALVRPEMERDGYAEVDMAEADKLTADDMQGAAVYGANDEVVGDIGELIMTDDGKVSEAIIDVGGFLGLGEKPVAVGFDKIQVMKSDDGEEMRFYIDSTEDKLNALPEYDS